MYSEEKDELLRKLREMEMEQKRMVAAFTNPIPKIEIPTYSLPSIDFTIFQPPKINIPSFSPHNIDFSVFKIPDISFPKIEIPEIDYKRIQEITNDNSKCGWTLTGEMSLADYLEDDLVGISHEEKDQYFYNYYSKKNWQQFGYMKQEIVEMIEPRWTGLIQECFDSFENDKYKLVIPALFTIVEGEMSHVFQSHKGSRALIILMETQAENEESKMKQISLYSVVHSMKEQLFLSHKFYENRNGLINRHWVLHGRDKPSHWKKEDALRLINIISSLQFIKEIVKEQE